MIVYTYHARTKLHKELSKLGITQQLVTGALRNPDELLYDALRERHIAIDYKHTIVIVYEKDNNTMTVITIIYSSELDDMVKRRKRTGRWI